MRRFFPKFLLLFSLFWGFLFYYCYYVQPNISGDLGRMGKIPFGKRFANYSVVGYERDYMNPAVVEVFNPDSCKFFKVVSVGDSFSQLNVKGYQWKLSALFNQPVGNLSLVIKNPIQDFVSLLESGYFDSGQTVIVENVERTLVDHLNSIDFSTKDSFTFRKRNLNEKRSETCLEGFFSWIRLRLCYENPVKSFTLIKECFSHPRYASTLFILYEKKYKDGDLFWMRNTDEEYVSARDNLARIESLANYHGIHFIFLIAPDKYDVYEPWIKTRHTSNPTLSYFKDEGSIICPKSFLQELVFSGEKDIYMCNDTHWSEKGADFVADLVFSRMTGLSK